MDIRLIIRTTDPEQVDTAHETGLSAPGFDDLFNALSEAGFEILDGPERLS